MLMERESEEPSKMVLPRIRFEHVGDLCVWENNEASADCCSSSSMRNVNVEQVKWEKIQFWSHMREESKKNNLFPPDFFIFPLVFS